jgi:hypothetical protein
MSIEVGPTESETVTVPETVWKLLPYFQNLIEDCGAPDDTLVVENVNIRTLAWLLQVAGAHTLPTKWTQEDFEQLCADGLPPNVTATLEGRDGEVIGMLRDLDYLGGGLFYDLCRVHAARLITKDNWSADLIRERFGIEETL